MARHRNDDFPLHSFEVFDGCAFGHATQSPLSCSNSLFSKLNAAYGERRTPSLASTIAAFISPVNATLGRSSLAEDPADRRL